MRRLTLIFGAVAMLYASNALAVDFRDTKTIIPIIGRFAGVNNTQWRTEVFLGSRFGAAATVQLTLHISGGAPLVRSVTIPAYGTVTLPDVVLNTFGLTNAAGPLHVDSTTRIEARARIFNSGNPAGEFGQSAAGLPVSLLGDDAYFYGLSGVDGNRVNIGITNPRNEPMQFSLYIADKDNNPLYRQDAIPLGPYQNLQYNDLFSRFGLTPQAGIQVNFFTIDNKTFYGYASQVRNDTGDAIFMFGTDPNQ
jgi:hypothetical protein